MVVKPVAMQFIANQYMVWCSSVLQAAWWIVQCGVLHCTLYSVVQYYSVVWCIVPCTVWWPFGPRVTSRLSLSPPSCLTELSGSAISCGFLISPHNLLPPLILLILLQLLLQLLVLHTLLLLRRLLTLLKLLFQLFTLLILCLLLPIVSFASSYSA